MANLLVAGVLGQVLIGVQLGLRDGHEQAEVREGHADAGLDLEERLSARRG